MIDLKIIIQFLIKINHTGNCWEWKAYKDKDGYGKFRSRMAHRFSYELFKGDISKGFQIDHLCRNTSCVNPDHLEIVTGQINVLRGFGGAAINSKKTHCPKGHELKEPNLDKTQLKYGKRRCVICRNEYDRIKRSEIKLRKSFKFPLPKPIYSKSIT